MMSISDAGISIISGPLKKQYFAEQRGEAIEETVPLNVDKQRI